MCIFKNFFIFWKKQFDTMYHNVEKMVENVENVENVRGNVYLFKMILFFEEKNSIRH